MLRHSPNSSRGESPTNPERFGVRVADSYGVCPRYFDLIGSKTIEPDAIKKLNAYLGPI